MNLKCLLFPVILIASLGCCAAGEPEWTTFGNGDDQKRFSNCFIIYYPSSFSVDPASGITPRLTSGKGLPIPEGNLHSLVLYDPEKSLEVRASSHGFLTEDFYRARGFASPREVILTDLFHNAMATKISPMKDFDLFYSETGSKVVAIFLDRNAKWGLCYQSVTFTFRNNTTLKDHSKVVEGIIAKFVPSFARSKKE